MGIRDLYPVIKDAAPDQIITYHLSELTGYRFAIDISVFLYKYIRSAGPDRWINSFMLLMCTLKRHGIKAVCIFDGPNPPIEKKEEQDRRRAENQKSLNRLAECIRIRNKLQDDYLPYDETLEPTLVKECRALIGLRRGYVDTTNYHDSGDVIDAFNNLIERLERQTLPITNDYRDKAIEIVEMMGLHGIVADGEAETLCAYLAVTGKVDAVLTEDTDVLAYGTPFMIAFKDFKLNEEKVVGIHLPSMLVEMEMEMEEFRDLCILLSCDYNSRVRGFPPDGRNRKKAVGIGAKGALCMIQEYRRLEEVCNHVEDPDPLKYRRCRELFTIPKTVPGDMIPYNLEPDYKRLAILIDERRLTIKLPYIEQCYRPAELTFDSDDSEEDPDVKRSKNDECVVVGRHSDHNNQFFTKPSVAEKCLAHVRATLGALEEFAYILEPSAGNGAFFDMLPPRTRVGIDIDAAPRSACVKMDFLDVPTRARAAASESGIEYVKAQNGQDVQMPPLDKKEEVLVVGNPPFGKNAATAIQFVNHALKIANTVCFILPRTFNKASVQNRVDLRAHLVFAQDVENNAFEFEGQDYDVPCTFQIWKIPAFAPARQPLKSMLFHEDFTFEDDASKPGVEFAVQRVGVNAGTVKTGDAVKVASPRSHYFIRPHHSSVIKHMQNADMTNSWIKYQTVGNPSISKGDLITMYNAQSSSKGRSASSAATTAVCMCLACNQEEDPEIPLDEEQDTTSTSSSDDESTLLLDR